MSLARQFQPIDAPKTAKPANPAPGIPGSKPGKKRGPKPSSGAKVLLTLRLKPETIAKFKATGPGWQSRMSDVLDAAKV